MVDNEKFQLCGLHRTRICSKKILYISILFCENSRQGPLRDPYARPLRSKITLHVLPRCPSFCLILTFGDTRPIPGPLPGRYPADTRPIPGPYPADTRPIPGRYPALGDDLGQFSILCDRLTDRHTDRHTDVDLSISNKIRLLITSLLYKKQLKMDVLKWLNFSFKMGVMLKPKLVVNDQKMLFGSKLPNF